MFLLNQKSGALDPEKLKFTIQNVSIKYPVARLLREKMEIYNTKCFY